MNGNELIKKSFKESLKFKEDLEKLELIKIQKELENSDITLKLARDLTRHLNKEQKNKLIELYKVQIKELENSIENYKIRILKIRNNNK